MTASKPKEFSTQTDCKSNDTILKHLAYKLFIFLCSWFDSPSRPRPPLWGSSITPSYTHYTG